MNRAYQVIWAGVAENDLKEILEYFAMDNPLSAFEIFREIKRRESSLYTFPERGRIVPELLDQSILIYRELVVSPWKIIYRISDKSVYVLSVLDSRRNVEDILLKRLAYYE